MNKIYITYPLWKAKAMTFSYDDGRVSDYKLVKIFNTYGLKSTFHLNSGLKQDQRIPLEEYPEVYKGHEVACHTVTHPTIAREPIEEVAMEVLQDRIALEAVMKKPVTGLSYPNGSTSSEIEALLPRLGITYSRTVTSTYSFDLPENWIHLNPTCHHREDILKRADDFIAFQKKQYLKMFYLWGHSFEFDRDDNWNLIESFAKKISGRDDIWYATNGEIHDYLKAAKSLVTTVEGDHLFNPTAYTIYLSVNDTDLVKIAPGESLSL